MLKIGHGYDFHRYAEGRKLYLGGIEIPHRVGLAGHSDADALIHAVCDALLGALALGDIGKHFPDTDNAYKDLASHNFLVKVMSLIAEQGFRVNNLDVSVVADHPKLAPYFLEMRQCLAKIMKLELNCISIKATTKEGCAPEGIAVHAVTLLESL